MGSCEKKSIEDYIVSIPDFPEKGIIFRDVTSVLQDQEGFKLAIDSLQKLLEGVDVDVIAAAESRGFIFGAPIAYNLHKPLVLIRKKGKLPRETIEQSYELEYGSAVLEMHKDSVKPGQKVVIIDDLMATGGTVEAAAKMIYTTFTPKKNVAAKATIITSMCITDFVLSTPEPKLKTTSKMTAATPACIPFKTIAT